MRGVLPNAFVNIYWILRDDVAHPPRVLAAKTGVVLKSTCPYWGHTARLSVPAEWLPTQKGWQALRTAVSAGAAGGPADGAAQPAPKAAAATPKPESRTFAPKNWRDVKLELDVLHAVEGAKAADLGKETVTIGTVDLELDSLEVMGEIDGFYHIVPDRLDHPNYGQMRVQAFSSGCLRYQLQVKCT